jgi:hypothetical protein
MTEFWKIILSSFLGALLALAGGYLLFRIQENRKLNNAKVSMHLELSRISKLLADTHKELISKGGSGTIQIMVNKINDKPSDFMNFKSILAQLPKPEFASIGLLYSKITEFEEVRRYLLDRKENGVELSELLKKESLTPDERTTIQFMRIYKEYFMNLDLLIREIEEVKEILK